jgi:hypothetical protein
MSRIEFHDVPLIRTTTFAFLPAGVPNADCTHALPSQGKQANRPAALIAVSSSRIHPLFSGKLEESLHIPLLSS